MRPFSVFLSLVCLALTGAGSAAAASEHGEVPPAKTASAEAWFQRMLDAGNPAQALKDPRAFLEWLDAISEPRSMTALGSVSATGAGQAANSLDKQWSPAAVHNWAEFIDPRLYLRQMLTGRGSGFQHAILDAPASPEKARRQAEAMTATALPSAGKPAPAPQPEQWFRLNVETVSPTAYRY
jgi:hypothetical protein